MRRFVVCVDWTDESYPLSSDVDEVSVYAASPAAAVTKAKARWLATKGAEHPTCRIDYAFVLTEAIRRNPDLRPCP